MIAGSERDRQRLAGGTTRIFLAEALLFPTGLITAMFLTRQLGPRGYGLFTLGASVAAGIEWTIHSLFTRATILLVGKADDWRAVGDRVLRLHLLVSGGSALLLCVLAPLLAALWHEPELIGYLRLFALEIPLVSMSYAHRDILVGRGGFKERALASAGRWTSRLVLILVLVEMGFSVRGAIVGSVGAALIELMLYRRSVRPSALRASAFPSRRLWEYGVPLFLAAVSMRLIDKLDLFALKALGGSAEQAGFYGAAQNMAMVPAIFALSFSPLVLSRITQLRAAGDESAARRLAGNALRLLIALFPFACLLAAAAGDLVTWIFGPRFQSSAPILSILVFAGTAMTLISGSTAILTAAGKLRWIFPLTAPLLVVAVVGHLMLIPRLGAIGAALVTTGTTSLGALTAVLAIHRLWGVLPPLGVVWRSVVVGGLVYASVTLWHTPGVLVFVKLAAVGMLILPAFWFLGEFSRRELMDVRSRFRPG